MKWQRLDRRRKKTTGKKVPVQGFSMADIEQYERIRRERMGEPESDKPTDHGEAHADL